MAQLVEHILGKDEVPGPNPGSSSNETLVERRGLLVSMGIFRPHPFAAIFRKGCGLFFMKKMRFREQSCTTQKPDVCEIFALVAAAVIARHMCRLRLGW